MLNLSRHLTRIPITVDNITCIAMAQHIFLQYKKIYKLAQAKNKPITKVVPYIINVPAHIQKIMERYITTRNVYEMEILSDIEENPHTGVLKIHPTLVTRAHHFHFDVSKPLHSMCLRYDVLEFDEIHRLPLLNIFCVGYYDLEEEEDF